MRSAGALASDLVGDARTGLGRWATVEKALVRVISSRPAKSGVSARAEKDLGGEGAQREAGILVVVTRRAGLVSNSEGRLVTAKETPPLARDFGALGMPLSRISLCFVVSLAMSETRSFGPGV